MKKHVWKEGRFWCYGYRDRRFVRATHISFLKYAWDLYTEDNK